VGDGGRLDVAVNGAIAQHGMPTGWEAWAGCEVAGEGLKEEWWGAADDSVDAEVRAHERLREVNERVRNASSARFGHKANVGAIMGKGGAKIKPSDAVSCPGCALQGSVIYDDELA
jgi:hypothetical protein